MLKRLDLHGLIYEDARAEVIHFIEDNWETANELKIITGNSEGMRKVVTDVADEYHLNYRIGGAFDNYNVGDVTVFMI